MDNIQKLILGVLGVSGMIAMVLPSGVSSKSNADETSVAVDAPVLGPPEMAEDGSEAEEEMTEESEFANEDIFVTGEPAIDGNPLQAQPEGNPAQAPQIAEQYVPPVIDYGQAAAPPPAINYPQAVPMPQPVLTN